MDNQGSSWLSSSKRAGYFSLNNFLSSSFSSALLSINCALLSVFYNNQV